MRWMSALLLCVLVASGLAVTTPSPPALAMQEPPSAAARAFCSEAEEDWKYERVTFVPARVEVGTVLVRDLTNPYPDPTPDAANPNPAPLPDSGQLVMTLVTLPAHTCILGSQFYPSMVMTMTSGDISILVEHLPGLADAPKVTVARGGAASADVPIGAPASLSANDPADDTDGDWVRIENEAQIGFHNGTDVDATFTVAGIKMAGDSGGGGGHTGRP